MNDKIVAIILASCVIVVGFWEIMSRRNRRPFQPFELTAADFSEFKPVSAAWLAERIPVAFSPAEPNVLAVKLSSRRQVPHEQGASVPEIESPVLVRLAHGYNMRDCMRIKGYTVELLQDNGQESGNPSREENEAEDTRGFSGPSAGRIQIWRLVSGAGDASIWVTGIIRAGDMRGTEFDVRSMRFPRITAPDERGFAWDGFQWKHARRPIRSLKNIFRHKWNGARCDWLTFLRLRQPVWANEELLTLVARSPSSPTGIKDEPACIARIVAAHAFIHNELKKWKNTAEK